MFGDSGVGISQVGLSRLFQPYFTTKAGGHGLGLMLIQRIMRAHGGQVGIDSKEGIGTVVTLTFPQKNRRVRMLESGEDSRTRAPTRRVAGPALTSQMSPSLMRDWRGNLILDWPDRGGSVLETRHPRRRRPKKTRQGRRVSMKSSGWFSLDFYLDSIPEFEDDFGDEGGGDRGEAVECEAGGGSVMDRRKRGALTLTPTFRAGMRLACSPPTNRMLRRIENFSNELGRKVEEATAELARRNEQLRGINKELFDTQKNLARSERLAVAGQLAASLAHEIGTPLNSISGHVQLLARRKSNDESTARRLLVIEKQVENIVRTVRQLLSWTRKFDLRLELVDLGHVLEDAVLLSSPVLEARKIRVQMTLAKDCPMIYGDSGYLHQVFLNLINNSSDAMPRGGELHISLRACGPTEQGEVEVTVTDSGTGMARETLAHIFDPMFTTKQIGTGAGLGLAICDQIVRQHSGTIHATSAPDHGTTFTIRLPLDCREKVEPPVLSTVASEP